MTYHSRNNVLDEILSIFTQVTRIQFYVVSFNDASSLKSFCKKCNLKENDLHNATKISVPYNVLMHGNGLCNIVVLSSHSNELIISESIQYDANNNTTHMNLSSLTIYNIAKLLFLALSAKDTLRLPYQNYAEGLLTSSNTEKPESVTRVVDDYFNALIEENGLDFDATKALCGHFLFTLREITLKKAGSLLPEQNYKFHFRAYAECDSFGKLKSCMQSAAEDVKNALFNASRLKQNDIIKQATQLMKERFSEKINQNMVAGAVFVSPSYFSKVFKDITGFHFNQYLNRLRIEKAKELLAKTSMGIEAVQKAVGYENRSYFGKIFLRITGTTPKQYRIIHQKRKKV